MSLAMVVGLRDAWPVKFDPTQVAFLLRAKGKQGRRQRPDLNLLAATEFAIGKNMQRPCVDEPPVCYKIDPYRFYLLVIPMIPRWQPWSHWFWRS